MMFTDKDVARYKNYTLWDIRPVDLLQEIHALIERLEAAEECIDADRGDCLADIGKKCSCGYSEKLANWQKLSGK